VPGYTGSKEDFVPILDPLAAQGFQAVAIDLPGQYESPGPTDPQLYTPRALAATIVELAAQLGDDVHLVGHSYGGLVARAAVLADPGPFASLVLMCSGPAALNGARRERMELLEPVLAAYGMAGVYAAMVAAEQADPTFEPEPPDVSAFMQTRFLASSPAMLKGIGDAIRTEPDRVAELAAIGRPTLVLHGVHDDAWPPSEQVEMAERLAADYVVITGAAHSPAVENPSPTAAALVEFWRRVS
jgi:pimeloyl-ACP methyl ester carboxylesterase